MKVAEAIVDFVGDFASVDAGLAGVTGKAEPIAKKVGAMFSQHLGAGIIMGGGAMTTLGGILVAASAPIEKAQAGLRAAVESTGKAFDATYQGKVAAAIKTQETFGHSQADTQDALAKLTIGFKDPQKALEEMTRAQELAAMKGISLSDAASLLVKTHAGSTRALKDFGINVKDVTGLQTTLTGATKTHDTAVSNLQKAQAALSDLEARDAATGKPLTISQQQQLAAAHQKVDDAQGKVKSSAEKLTAAQAAVTGQAKTGEDAFNKLIDKYHGAEDVSGTFAGKVDMVKTKLGDFAGSMGGVVGPAMAGLGPTMMAAGGLVETGALGMIGSGAKIIANFVIDTAKFGAQLVVRGVMWAASNLVYAATALAAGVAAAAAFLLPLAPFILIGLAVAVLAVLIATHFNQIADFAKQLAGNIWNFISGAFNNVMNWVKGNWPLLLGILGGPIGLAVALIATHFDQIKALAKGVVDNIVGFFTGIPGRLLGVGKDILHTIGQAFAGAAKNIPVFGGAMASFLQSFDQGGVVGGLKGSPQLVIAHGGERVLTAAQQQGAGGGQTIINNFNAPIDPAAGRRIGRDLAWEMKA